MALTASGQLPISAASLLASLVADPGFCAAVTACVGPDAKVSAVGVAGTSLTISQTDGSTFTVSLSPAVLASLGTPAGQAAVLGAISAAVPAGTPVTMLGIDAGGAVVKAPVPAPVTLLDNAGGTLTITGATAQDAIRPIGELAVATTPLVAGDELVVLQGGAHKRVSATSVGASAYGPLVLATINATAVPTSAFTSLTYTELTDTHGAFDPTNGTFVAPISGVYQVEINFDWSAASWGATTQSFIGLLTAANVEVPGGTWSNFTSTAVVTQAKSVSGSGLVRLTAAASYAIKVWQNSGGVRNVSAARNAFAISFVRP